MKSFLQSLFLCLPFLSYSQITFEYLTAPEDFSIGAVRESPIGEYFVQAADDWKSIYTSLDGVKWIRTSLPVAHEFYDIQFYADGTPVLKPEYAAHLIRRDGIWYSMNAGGGDLVEASFIKGDTLFMYHDKRFAYSLDKGQTFITVFEYAGDLIDHTAHLWKFESYFILHHTAGAQDYLSVFNLNGDRVLSDTLELNFGQAMTYNSCGQMLLNDEDNYYLLQESGIFYQTGLVTDILPPIGFGYYLASQGGEYYFRNENTIYKTNGCNFDWQIYAANDLIEAKEHIWFNHLGEIFLFDKYDDFFTVEAGGSDVENYPEIHHPVISVVNESTNGYQFSVTANDLFNKNTGDDKWIELDTSSNQVYQAEYSPGGDLYVVRRYDILYSTDNGYSYSTLPLPISGSNHNFFLEVLGDDFLFFISGGLGHGFYTLDNGQHWIDTGKSFDNGNSYIKLIGNDILIADVDNGFKFTKINVVTNAKVSESFDRIAGTLSSVAAILDDGTFYIQLELFIPDYAEGYYRFRFGEGLKYLGPYPQLANTTIASSGNDLFAFGPDNYYLLHGENFIAGWYDGMPSTNAKKFIISQNEYLYAIVNQTSMYRSTRPLSIPTSTNKPDAFVDFNVFPNPANKELTLMIDDSAFQRIDSYDIIDQLGRIVDHSGYLSNQVINVSKLNAGFYMVLLKEGGNVVGMKRFVKD